MIFGRKRRPIAPAFGDYRHRPAAGRYGGTGTPGSDAASPLVSIVTVVRNGERFLDETIRSVIAQDYPYIEYIIIDGASTDSTLDIIARHQAHISHWRSEPDSGIYDAMNKGIGLANGQLIKLLNADDVLLPGAISTAVRAYQRLSKPCVITGDIEVIDPEGTRLKTITAARFLNPVGAVLHPSWLVDRAIYEHHGLYDPTITTSSDYELFVRLHSRGVPFHHVGEALVQFRTGGASTGFGGVADSYYINHHYFGRAVAIKTALRHSIRKLRAHALDAALSDRQLQHLHRWHASRRRRPASQP